MKKGIAILIDGKMVLYIHEDNVSNFVENTDSGKYKIIWKKLIENSKNDYKLNGDVK